MNLNFKKINVNAIKIMQTENIVIDMQIMIANNLFY